MNTWSFNIISDKLWIHVTPCHWIKRFLTFQRMVVPFSWGVKQFKQNSSCTAQPLNMKVIKYLKCWQPFTHPRSFTTQKKWTLSNINVTVLQSVPTNLGFRSVLIAIMYNNWPSNWPFSLRFGSAAVHLPGLRAGIPLGPRMSFSCSCCVCQVQVPVSGWSLAQGSPSECGVS